MIKRNEFGQPIKEITLSYTVPPRLRALFEGMLIEGNESIPYEVLDQTLSSTIVTTEVPNRARFFATAMGGCSPSQEVQRIISEQETNLYTPNQLPQQWIFIPTMITITNPDCIIQSGIIELYIVNKAYESLSCGTQLWMDINVEVLRRINGHPDTFGVDLRNIVVDASKAIEVRGDLYLRCSMRGFLLRPLI